MKASTPEGRMLVVLLIAQSFLGVALAKTIPITNVTKQTRIISGSNAVNGRYPYTVSLQSGNFHFCGGSLIAPDVVLSAAHCEPNNLNNRFVRVDPYNLNNPNPQSSRRQITEAYPHPEYGFSLANDVMLLKLSSPVNNVEPIRINNDPAVPNVGQMLDVMGWGTTVSGSDVPPDVLQFTPVTYVSNAVCRVSYGSDEITPDMLCCQEAGSGSCQGDSGGPLVVPNGPNSDVQVGVVSWGTGCALQAYPGVYNRLSNSYNWIRETLCDISNKPPDYLGCGGPTPPPPPPTSPEPTPLPTIPPALAPSAGNQVSVLLQIQMDNFPEEVGWGIFDVVFEQTVYSTTPGTYQVIGQQVSEVLTLIEGRTYNLVLIDQQGDGLCCDYGVGNVALFLGTSADPDRYLGYSDGQYFSRQEIQFLPSEAGISSSGSGGGSGGGGGGGTGSGEVGSFTLLFETDDYPQESAWGIISVETGVVLEVESLAGYSPRAVVPYTFELELGETYVLSVLDDAGDGLCCQFGSGQVSLYYGAQVDNTKLLAYIGGNFLSESSMSFYAADSSIGSSSGTIPPGNGLFTLIFTTDDYSEENRWVIEDASSGDVVWYDYMGRWNDGIEVTYSIDLTFGRAYVLRIFDSVGDGICCGWGSGSAAIYSGESPSSSNLLGSTNGQFDTSISIPFTAMSLSPTPQPTFARPPTEPPALPPATELVPPEFEFCFPADAVVTSKDRGQLLMKDLKIGDNILVAKGRYETVYSFGHKANSGATIDFIQIVTETSKLELSAQHLVFMADGTNKAANRVAVGEKLMTDGGEEAVVIQVNHVSNRGLFAPYTPSGRIVVNGIQCSSFVALQAGTDTMLVGGWDTGMSFHYVSLLFTYPQSMYSQFFGLQPEAYNEIGMSAWSHLGKTFFDWTQRQESFVQIVVLLPALGFALLFYNSIVLAWFLLSLGVGRRVMGRTSKAVQLETFVCL